MRSSALSATSTQSQVVPIPPNAAFGCSISSGEGLGGTGGTVVPFLRYEGTRVGVLLLDNGYDLSNISLSKEK
jgi:hypothetical protein